MSILKKLKTVSVLSLIGLSVSFAAQSATEIMVAYGNQPGEPIDKAMHYWAEQVKEKSNGDIIFKLFPSSQLGSETEVMEQAKFGANIITISDYGALMDIVPDLGIINAPYLSQSFEKKSKLLHSEWFNNLSAQLDQKGVHIVIPDVIYGTRHLLTKKAVTKPDDLKGMKVRVQHSRLFVATIKAMGGVPTPMSLADVYPGLSEGIIDGLENPTVVLFGGKFYEVAKNLNLTAHTKHMSPFVAGNAFWQRLTPEQQNIIKQTGVDMVKYGAALIEQNETEALNNLKDAGVSVNEVDLELFEAMVKEQIQKDFPEWTPNLYIDIQKRLSEL
ncbi:DctP family TRAP transporter solute-binding subunit [Pasteurellaceae bacterium USgator11]|nr:DctP family TRAP transporter solute-binding subunit [Pasteurellaceae bacterium USgator41]TNG97256.1 DctP family TRAP transporter solute-binding subunit [Pasteurellaceae bacterium UScroc12]TNG99834.1 DctP family TRAP transporter solute-binding subunit [Pasteurellaceae bacterium UScroc31]TNH01063.1 DctP family TRAP transporter solute-binding subunit [Pasteurellaceae bacterium USgator11]